MCELTCTGLEIVRNQNLQRNCNGFRMLLLVFKSLDCCELPCFSFDQKNDLQVFRLLQGRSPIQTFFGGRKHALDIWNVRQKIRFRLHFRLLRKNWSLTWLFAFDVAYAWPRVTAWKDFDSYYPVLAVMGRVLKQGQWGLSAVISVAQMILVLTEPGSCITVEKWVCCRRKELAFQRYNASLKDF